MPVRCLAIPAQAAAQQRQPYLLTAQLVPSRRYFMLKRRWSPGLPKQEYRSFHASPPLRDSAIDNSRNHYETLKLHPGATPAEIKKYVGAPSSTLAMMFLFHAMSIYLVKFLNTKHLCEGPFMRYPRRTTRTRTRRTQTPRSGSCA